MPDFQNAKLKIERAKKHIRDLNIEKAAFLALNPYDVTPEYYAEHNATAYFLDKFQPTPPVVALAAGDAAHNLRSALDFLAIALVREAGNEPGTHTYFPISKSFEKYEAESPRKIEGMTPSTKEAIGLLKPYRGGNDALWGLHMLDIIDKHRLLMTPAIAVDKVGFRMSKEYIEREFRGFIRFAPGTHVPQKTIWFPVPAKLLAANRGDIILSIAGNHEANQDVEVTFDIALGEPEVFKGRAILETLVQLGDLVEGIVSSFE